MSPRVLFVDDEPNILQSLRRTLLPLTKAWDMTFVSSGEEALLQLDAQPVDVVVSDLKMPVMDGVELLNEVRRRHPAIARVVFSGYSDRGKLTASALPAHLFLEKPSSRDEIQEVLERIIDLQRIPLQRDLVEAATGMGSLPGLPAVHRELLEVLEGDRQESDKLMARAGRLVARDMGLTASILKLVNSPFFGSNEQVLDPARAAALLGLDTIRALCGDERFFTGFDGSRFTAFTPDRLWAHGQRTAQLARTICSLEGGTPRELDKAYAAGLMHDIGKLVLAESREASFRAGLASSREHNIPVAEAEHRVVGSTHAELGGYLLGLWNLDQDVVMAVAAHHEPTRNPGHLVTTALHVANALDHELVVENVDYAPHPINTEHLEAEGLAHRLDSWRKACAEPNGQGADHG